MNCPKCDKLMTLKVNTRGISGWTCKCQAFLINWRENELARLPEKGLGGR